MSVLMWASKSMSGWPLAVEASLVDSSDGLARAVTRTRRPRARRDWGFELPKMDRVRARRGFFLSARSPRPRVPRLRPCWAGVLAQGRARAHEPDETYEEPTRQLHGRGRAEGRLEAAAVRAGD